MNRILLMLAAINYVLVVATMLVGLVSNPAGDPSTLGDDPFRFHFPLGVGTAIYTLFVHCLVFTYFIGTNRWTRETVAAYSLSADLTRKSRACRTRAFAMATISMLLVVASVATGAGAHTRVWPLWLHQVIPAASYLFMVYAYRVEIGAIEEHIALTDEVMDRVNEIRRARGLPLD